MYNRGTIRVIYIRGNTAIPNLPIVVICEKCPLLVDTEFYVICKLNYVLDIVKIKPLPPSEIPEIVMVSRECNLQRIVYGDTEYTPEIPTDEFISSLM